MSYMSNMILVGNLGRDPEQRFTPSGKAVTNFSLAVNQEYTGADGAKVKETVWFKVTAWGKLAEICSQYLKKGNPVLVEVRLDYDKATGNPKTWEDKDGKTHAGYDVVAQAVKFIGAGNGAPKTEGGVPAVSDAIDDDQIPF